MGHRRSLQAAGWLLHPRALCLTSGMWSCLRWPLQSSFRAVVYSGGKREWKGGRAGGGGGGVWSGEERQRIKKSQTPLPVSAVTVIWNYNMYHHQHPPTQIKREKRKTKTKQLQQSCITTATMRHAHRPAGHNKQQPHWFTGGLCKNACTTKLCRYNT